MGMAALLEPVIALVWDQEAFVVLMQTLLSTLLILFCGRVHAQDHLPHRPQRHDAILCSARVAHLCGSCIHISKFTSDGLEMASCGWAVVKIEHHTDVLMR